mmetsp:Transcript_31521/g.41739  ORF Transcript_31521/g.41739 Transcript_31521/m.41739 type:complete len:101 (+) Transcript_31521:313-615(+)
MKFFQMLTRLLQVQVLFVNFFNSLQGLFQDPVLAALGGDSSGTGFLPTETVELLKVEKPHGLLSMYTIADTLPGSDCKQFGYRLGVLARMAQGKFLPTDA